MAMLLCYKVVLAFVRLFTLSVLLGCFLTFLVFLVLRKIVLRKIVLRKIVLRKIVLRKIVLREI